MVKSFVASLLGESSWLDERIISTVREERSLTELLDTKGLAVDIGVGGEVMHSTKQGGGGGGGIGRVGGPNGMVV